VLAPLVVLVFAIGIFPNPLIQRIQPSVKAFVAEMQAPEIGKVALIPPPELSSQPTVPPPAPAFAAPNQSALGR
jgi:hypothetical protein